MYKQLQDILNKYIDLGWKPFGLSKLSFSGGRFVINNTKSSYHDLFSKDSGIMEFVEWKEISQEIACNVVFCGDGLDCDRSVSGTSSDKNVRSDYHYMIMGPMTTAEKVQYFVNNAIIPQIKSE